MVNSCYTNPQRGGLNYKFQSNAMTHAIICKVESSLSCQRSNGTFVKSPLFKRYLKWRELAADCRSSPAFRTIWTSLRLPTSLSSTSWPRRVTSWRVWYRTPSRPHSTRTRRPVAPPASNDRLERETSQWDQTERTDFILIIYWFFLSPSCGSRTVWVLQPNMQYIWVWLIHLSLADEQLQGLKRPLKLLIYFKSKLRYGHTLEKHSRGVYLNSLVWRLYMWAAFVLWRRFSPVLCDNVHGQDSGWNTLRLGGTQQKYKRKHREETLSASLRSYHQHISHQQPGKNCFHYLAWNCNYVKKNNNKKARYFSFCEMFLCYLYHVLPV